MLLADDHPIVAEGLVSLLREQFDLVGTVGDGRSLVDAALKLQPDLIVADIGMPGLSGLEALRELKSRDISARTIILTMHGDPQLASEALRAGAVGYLLKQSAGEELLNCIEEVLQGRVYMTPLLSGILQGSKTRGQDGMKLTPRQREVLRLVAEGRTMREIALDLRLSRRTVETHKYEMMQALGVQSTAELIRYAVRLGLVQG